MASPQQTKPRPNPKLVHDMAKGLPVNPSFVPLPKVDVVEVGALNRPCVGSEDQIIPDSDGEVDEEVEPPPRKLDLSRFAFS